MTMAKSVIRVGNLVLNPENRSVEFDGLVLHLTEKEYDVLELLSLNQAVTVPRAVFLDHLYNGMGERTARIVDVFVCRLRKKLADATHGQYHIRTEWGCGYALHHQHDHRAGQST